MDMARVRSLTTGLSPRQSRRVYALAGWLSKQHLEPGCLERILEDAKARLEKTPNLYAYYSKNGPARARIEGTWRAESQEIEADRFRQESRRAPALNHPW